MNVIDSFCSTLDTNVLKRLSVRDIKLSIDVLKYPLVNVEKVDINKQHIYYLLLAYFKPSKITDYLSDFPHPKVPEICAYLQKK